jgi:hypothetical protein
MASAMTIKLKALDSSIYDIDTTDDTLVKEIKVRVSSRLQQKKKQKNFCREVLLLVVIEFNFEEKNLNRQQRSREFQRKHNE